MATVLITGANRGIGLALARAYAARGDTVSPPAASPRRRSPTSASRSMRASRSATTPRSTGSASSLGKTQIDMLINNAGIHSNETLDDLNFDRIRKQIEVNALGPLRVTRALLPHLHEGSKVVIVTSRSGSIGDNGSGRTYGYRMSKAAVNMAGVNLAHRSEAARHPGAPPPSRHGEDRDGRWPAERSRPRTRRRAWSPRIDDLSLDNHRQVPPRGGLRAAVVRLCD